MKNFLLVILVLVTGSSCSVANNNTVNSCSLADEAIEEAAKLRGLKVLKPIKCKSESKENFRRFAQQTLLLDISLKQLPYEQRVLFLLGLIDEDYDYSRCFVDSLTAEAAAFYSAREDYFVVPNWSKTPKVILVHEAVHALEDQHYNTSRFGTDKFLFTDENLAAAALMEGSAMMIEQEFIALNPKEGIVDLDMSAKLKPELKNCELAETLQEIFHGIYSYGAYFTHELNKYGDKALIETAFARIPLTSSEILNPRKYLSGVRYYKNVPIPKPKSIPANRAPELSQTIGEMVIRILFKKHFDLKTATLASSGWAGDTFAYYREGEKEEFVWHTRWEKKRDADQFFRAIRTIYEKRFAREFSKNSNIFSLTKDGEKVIEVTLEKKPLALNLRIVAN